VRERESNIKGVRKREAYETKKRKVRKRTRVIERKKGKRVIEKDKTKGSTRMRGGERD